jgi:hypothetical protein
MKKKPVVSKWSVAKVVDASKEPAGVLESILAEARALPPGSDVEGFMERRLAELARSARGAVARVRAEDQAAASREAGFSPSGVPGVRGGGQARADGAAPDRDDVGRGRV